MSRQKTQAYISKRQVMNLIGPPSRISAFWQGSAGVKEAWGQAGGSGAGQSVQPDGPG